MKYDRIIRFDIPMVYLRSFLTMSTLKVDANAFMRYLCLLCRDSLVYSWKIASHSFSVQFIATVAYTKAYRLASTWQNITVSSGNNTAILHLYVRAGLLHRNSRITTFIRTEYSEKIHWTEKLQLCVIFWTGIPLFMVQSFDKPPHSIISNEISSFYQEDELRIGIHEPLSGYSN